MLTKWWFYNKKVYGMSTYTGNLNGPVGKNDEFFSKNEELCIQNEELCTKNEWFCILYGDFCSRSMTRRTTIHTTAQDWQESLQTWRIAIYMHTFRLKTQKNGRIAPVKWRIAPVKWWWFCIDKRRLFAIGGNADWCGRCKVRNWF